jgi:eukaryotic-like serine/threonine-protein kinase
VPAAHHGERFGRYTVYECLGTGGMATVHRATVEIGGGILHEVALKRLLPQLADEQKLVEDFVREAKLAAQLQHPNIVRILELGRTGGAYFIAMELVHGSSLLALMKVVVERQGVVPVGIVVAILAEILDALDYASTAAGPDGEPLEIIHRDLSPSNLIITPEGNLKIIDFGVAKSVRGQFMTQSGMIKGKLGYMALESLAGKPIDRRADLFSVGVVAWELLCGRRLFVGANEYEVIGKIKQGVVTPPSRHNPECPPELDEIVLHALSRRRDDRWPSAAVMKRALDHVRRTYRDGVRELAAWRRALIPEPVFDDNITSEVSLRDVQVVPSQSITGVTLRRPPVDDITVDEEIADTNHDPL